MRFTLVLPLIVLGIVITIIKKAAEQNKRAEEMRRAAQKQAEQPAFEGQQSYTPVRPSVQVPPVRKATPAPQSVPSVGKAYQSPLAKPAQTHPTHDDCSLRSDAKKAPTPPWQHPEHEDCSLDEGTASKPAPYSLKKNGSALRTGGTDLDFTPDSVVRGVLFSEILGKPKALR